MGGVDLASAGVAPEAAGCNPPEGEVSSPVAAAPESAPSSWIRHCATRRHMTGRGVRTRPGRRNGREKLRGSPMPGVRQRAGAAPDDGTTIRRQRSVRANEAERRRRRISVRSPETHEQPRNWRLWAVWGARSRSVAELLVETGDVRRFTEGGFRRFNATAPLPASTARRRPAASSNDTSQTSSTDA